MKILVIEDEPKSAAFLSKGLGEAGFAVILAADGEEGLAEARAGAHDLIVLDVGVPRRDGWSVMAELRQGGAAPPVLFLTARDAVEDRVRGLELGAEDYLVKPFAFSELLARIRTILRRAAGRGPERLRVADLELDLARQRATRAGQRLDLTATEFSLLACLVRHQRRDAVPADHSPSRSGTCASRATPTSSMLVCAACARRWTIPSRPNSSTRSGGSAMSAPNAPERAPAPVRPSLSLAARLTAWYAGTTFAMVALASGCLYWALESRMGADQDARLADQVQILRANLDRAHRRAAPCCRARSSTRWRRGASPRSTCACSTPPAAW